MAEAVNIKIQADKSGAEEAVKGINKSLDEGKQAAEALSHVLDGDLSGAFKSLGELGKTLGVTLDLAFDPAEAIALVKAVVEVADKLSKLIADTFIYTDAQKAQDKALKSTNDTLAKTVARVKELGRETQIAAEKTEAGKEKLRLQFKLEDLGGSPEALHAKLVELTKQYQKLASQINSPTPKFAMHNEIGQAEQDLAKLQEQIEATKAALDIAEAESKKANQAINQDNAADAARQTKSTDAYVSHVVKAHVSLTQQVKKLAEERAQDDINANIALAKYEEQRIAKITADEKKAAKEKQENDEATLKKQISDAQASEQVTEATLDKELAQHKITKTQEIAAVAAAKLKELEQEKSYYTQIAALYEQGTAKWTEAQKQISKIDKDEIKVREKASADEARAAEQQWQKLTSGMESTFSSFTQGIISGHQTISQSWTKMVDDITNKFIQSLQRQLVEMIIQAATKDSVDEAYYAKSSLRAAYDTAHKAFDWATQYVGPVLAMPVAMAAFAAAESLGSAEGGQYYVPNNQLTMLHPQEMVLPAGIANQMRNVIGGGGSGGGATVIVNHTVQAIDASSFQQHIRRHSNMIANEVTRALKRKA